MIKLLAMLLYNIVIGSTVMFKKDKADMEKDYENGTFYINRSRKHASNEHTVVDIFSTLGWSTVFRPKGLFQIAIVIKNRSGSLQHVGIRAVKPVRVITF